MEKIQKEKTKELPYVKLYLEDIREILSVLNESGISDPRLLFGDTRVNESEIESLPFKKAYSMSISAYDPVTSLRNLFSLDISQNCLEQVIIHVEDTVIGNGLLLKVEDVLKRKRRLFLWLFFSRGAHLFPLVCFCAPIVVMGTIFLSLGYSSLFCFSLLIIYYIFLISVNFFINKNIILLESRLNYQNFFIRNKDALGVNLLCTTIGVALGFFLGKFFG